VKYWEIIADKLSKTGWRTAAASQAIDSNGRKIVGSRNLRVLIDCSDPGLENLFPVGEHKISKPSGAMIVTLLILFRM
jgi:hypothetical protein